MKIATVRKRITKRPDVRRQELMDAAIRVFAEKGITRTTVSDIAQAAGVAKGTFYLYFTSKEHLLGALKERFVGDILAHATSLYVQVGREDWWALLEKTIDSFVDWTLENRDLIHIMVQEGMTPETSELFAECEARIDEMMGAGIRAGVEAGVFRISDPEMTAQLLHHALDGTVQYAILYDKDFDWDRLKAAAKEMARKVLSP